jgi:hypothetical protein
MDRAARVKLANIGPRQLRRRLVMGIVALVLGGALAVALIWSRADPGWLLLTFVPFFLGLLGLVQAHECT